MAGFFGLLYLTIAGMCGWKEGISEISHDTANRKKSRETGDLTYFDSRGRLRFTETGEHCHYKQCRNNHYQIVKVGTYEVLYDEYGMWVNKRNQELEEAKQHQFELRKIAEEQGKRYFQCYNNRYILDNTAWWDRHKLYLIDISDKIDHNHKNVASQFEEWDRIMLSLEQAYGDCLLLYDIKDKKHCQLCTDKLGANIIYYIRNPKYKIFPTEQIQLTKEEYEQILEDTLLCKGD